MIYVIHTICLILFLFNLYHPYNSSHKYHIIKKSLSLHSAGWVSCGIMWDHATTWHHTTAFPVYMAPSHTQRHTRNSALKHSSCKSCKDSTFSNIGDLIKKQLGWMHEITQLLEKVNGLEWVQNVEKPETEKEDDLNGHDDPTL